MRPNCIIGSKVLALLLESVEQRVSISPPSATLNLNLTSERNQIYTSWGQKDIDAMLQVLHTGSTKIVLESRKNGLELIYGQF